MSLLSAITSRGKMRFMIKEKGGVHASVFIEFLKRLLVGATKPVFLIVDRGPAHMGSAQGLSFLYGTLDGSRTSIVLSSVFHEQSPD
jgi:hypothetical protein